LLGRYSSEIRTGCANKRPSGSVRGAVSNDRPYRDPKTSAPASIDEMATFRHYDISVGLQE
jgi:hypothetical protein